MYFKKIFSCSEKKKTTHHRVLFQLDLLERSPQSPEGIRIIKTKNFSFTGYWHIISNSCFYNTALSADTAEADGP